jgi:hypothetical protein
MAIKFPKHAVHVHLNFRKRLPIGRLKGAPYVRIVASNPRLRTDAVPEYDLVQCSGRMHCIEIADRSYANPKPSAVAGVVRIIGKMLIAI